MKIAQAGIHGLVGVAVQKIAPKKEWLMLGIILGNLLPDMDALAVAYATLTGGDYLPKLRLWTWIEIGLFAAFLVLVYIWSGYYIAFGALYILSLGLALGVTIRMRKAVEALPQT
jgi:hypothetical protein